MARDRRPRQRDGAAAGRRPRPRSPASRIAYPVQANAVFVALPAAVTERLREDYRFYTWDEQAGVVRWMCSWQTTPDDVDALVGALREAVAAG